MGEARLALVVFGVPVKGKRNPYVIGVAGDASVSYSISVEEADTPRLRVTGEPPASWRLEFALRAFLDELSSRLEQPLHAVIEYTAPPETPMSSLYAVLSLALASTVAEEAGYTMTTSELLEATSSIDDEAGVGLDYVKGLRAAAAYGRSIVYREGEEPIPVDLDVDVELVGEEELGRVVEDELGDTLLSAITRLAGLAVIEAANHLREKTPWESLFRLAARVDNALYYLLYGVEPPGEDCKWTPSLQAVHAVCLEGAGQGRRVHLE